MSEHKQVNGNEIKKPSESALLAEYQVCQQGANSNALSYWALSGIFFGFSATVLGIIITGIFGNTDLLKEYVNSEHWQTSRSIWMLRIAVSVFGIAMIVIYFSLKKWLKRTQHLSDIFYSRMREIEAHLGMRIHLLIQGIDCWNKLTAHEQQTLEVAGKGKNWCNEQKHAPSSRRYFCIIFCTLAILWAITIVTVWLLPVTFYWFGLPLD